MPEPAYDAATDFLPVILIAQVPIGLLTKNPLPGNDMNRSSRTRRPTTASQLRLRRDRLGGPSGLRAASNAAPVFKAATSLQGHRPGHERPRRGQVDDMFEILSTASRRSTPRRSRRSAIFSRSAPPCCLSCRTADEQGLKGFEAYTWRRLFLPRARRSRSPPASTRSRASDGRPGGVQASGRPGAGDRLGRQAYARVPWPVVKARSRSLAKPIKESGAKAE